MGSLRGKLSSVVQRASRALRSITGLEKEDRDISSPTSIFTASPYEVTNPLTNYALQAKLRKEMALAHWHIWENRPK